MKPLVSICIPTYNRSSNLRKTIESIVIQQEFVDKKVEIVISDNASTDNTEEVGREYANKYENISYFRNKENIRDKNFPLVLSRANGVLRKLNNDTLEINDGSLKDFCDLVLKYRDKKPVIFLKNSEDNNIPNYIIDFETAINKLSYLITYIGSYTMWDDDCKDVENDTDGCELLLWQVKKFLELASKKNAVFIYHKVFGTINSVAKKDISYGLYKVFYVNYFSLLKPYFESGQLSSKTKDYLERDLLFSFYPYWIYKWEANAKELKYSDTENLKKDVFNQYKDKEYFNEFLRYYNFKKMKFKTKEVIKKVLHI